jgi:hypothetical protein
MPRINLALASLATLAVVGLAACSSDTAPTATSDASLTADLARSSGDAIATDVGDLVGNEQYAGVSADVAPSFTAVSDSSSFSRVRTRTCYDAGGNVVACGQGLTSSVVVTLQLDGYRAGDKFTAIVHRQRHDSISGIHSPDSTRTHNGYGASQDTATFTGDVNVRTAGIAASDSVIDLVFKLPHANNPWPLSGQVIRNVDATFTIAGATNQTRTVQRRVVVTFPADAEGNVPIQVGTMTCNLNLVTHVVSGCTGS